MCPEMQIILTGLDCTTQRLLLSTANNESPCQTADVELNGSSDISLTQYFSNVSLLSAVASNIRSPLSSPNAPVSV